MFFKKLETQRLYLPNISLEDREFIFSHFSNEKVNRYLFDAEPLVKIQEADEIIDSYTQPEPRNQHRWILVRKNDGMKLGTCGFHCWNQFTSSCDIGYDLFPDFWGKGYMSEVIYEILIFAKKEMEIKIINACIYIENIKSIELIQKFGFIFSGQTKDEIFRGIKYPHMIYSLYI
jgi:ribosomal-protein-alanine N-acetyltransferase